MNIYTIHFYKSGDIKTRAQKIANEAQIVGLGPNSLLVASELSEKEIVATLAEPVFVFNQFSTGWRGPAEVSAETNDRIDHILRSGPPTPVSIDRS